MLKIHEYNYFQLWLNHDMEESLVVINTFREKAYTVRMWEDYFDIVVEEFIEEESGLTCDIEKMLLDGINEDFKHIVDEYIEERII